MKTEQLLKNYEVLNGEYKIIPAQKRTVIIVIKSYFSKTPPTLLFKTLTTFPKSLFFHYNVKNCNQDYPMASVFAINEQNDVCCQPFYNVDQYGTICIHSKDKKILIR